MGSPLGPTIANVFFAFYEVKWLEQYRKGFRPVFYRRYAYDIFVLFESAEHLSKSRDCFNTCLFPLNKKKNGKLSLLDVEVSRKKENL